MTYLLDINLLVALAWPTHVHHGAALAWFRRNQASGWATCPLTQSGFMRVSANASVVSGGVLATLDGKIRSLVPRGRAVAEVLCLVLEG